MLIDCAMTLLGDLSTTPSPSSRVVDFHVVPLAVPNPETHRMFCYGGFSMFTFNIAQLLANQPLCSVSIESDKRILNTRYTCGKMRHFTITTIPMGMLFGDCGIAALAVSPDVERTQRLVQRSSGLEVGDLTGWRSCVSGPSHRPLRLSVPVTREFGSLCASQPLDAETFAIGISFETVSRKGFHALRPQDFIISLRIDASVELTEMTPDSRVVSFRPLVRTCFTDVRYFEDPNMTVALKDGLPFTYCRLTDLNRINI